ncbi:hypothetical protein PILCRDRAFT_9686 [Piloderma croceum F 1598]|uniref:Uncharacterized protein n=1 Tax=Piloderma croceum (strain F 1598) TaxID=765440 RepID=A0A0C3BS36_PILCF|nr:hypothetical protein PILCRDRAFT_9686 [Piloderma croceum F 1598]
MPQEQLYFRASFPPQAAVAPPPGAVPTTGGPHLSDIQTDSSTTYHRSGGVSEHSRSPIMTAGRLPIDNQQRELQFPMTTLPQAISTQQQLSKTPSGYFGAPEPYDNAPFDLQSLNSQPTGSHPGSHTRPLFTTATQLPAQNKESVYSFSSMNPATNSMTTMQQASYLMPQSEVVPKSSPSPYMDEQVPALTTQPKFNWKDNACIVSRDPLLNNDGDALYRFILDHMDPPSVQLHCFGSHVVTELVAHGSSAKMKKTTVVDFNFVVDLALSMKPGSGELYTCGDDVVTYRGGMVKKIGVKGSPVKTVRDWVRNYTGSPKTGKEFRFNKVISEIDMPKIRDAVNQIISSTGYSSVQNVYFTVGNSSIKVQADSSLTRMPADGLKYLRWIDLVYPFVWMYRRFGKQGGKWDVCRASFTCNRDPRDPHKVIGVPLGDGDWVKIWERTIRLGIRNRIQTTQPIYRPTADDSEVIVFD